MQGRPLAAVQQRIEKLTRGRQVGGRKFVPFVFPASPVGRAGAAGWEAEPLQLEEDPYYGTSEDEFTKLTNMNQR